MGNRWVLVVIGIFFLYIMVAEPAEAVFGCEIRNESFCLSNQTLLVRLNSSEETAPNNTHVQLANFTGNLYGYSLCCWTDDFRGMNNTCTGDYTRVLGLAETNNTHVQNGTLSSYVNSACYNMTGNFQCEYPNDACSAGYAEVASMVSSEVADDNMTNAHMGEFDVYKRKICCTVGNTPPVIVSLIVNSTFGLNRTSENLTAYYTTSDADVDTVYVTHNWSVNGTPIAMLILPFDVNTTGNSPEQARDYARNNWGNVSGATWSSNGVNGTGTYEFDGVNDFIILNETDMFDSMSEGTIMFWAKGFDGQDAWQNIFIARNESGSDCSSPEFFQIGAGDGSLEPQVFIDTNGGCNGEFYISDIGGSTYGDGNWHHFVFLVNGSGNAVFWDGQQVTPTYSIGSASSQLFFSDASLGTTRYKIGESEFNSGESWNGSIDDFRIYNRSVSPEQIEQIYLNRSDIIVSQETKVGENWTDCVTPNDAQDDGATVCSEGLLILDKQPPEAVSLLYPLDGNTTVFERFVNFSWTDAVDWDGDPITYMLNFTVEAGACAVEAEVSGITPSNYTYGELCVDQRYWWNVTACDEDGCSAVSETFNFTIPSVLAVTIVNTSVNFGQLSNLESVTTDELDPRPFYVENIGNVFANVSLNGSIAPFSSVGLGDTAFQVKADENETGSVNLTGSQTSYVPVEDFFFQLFRQLNYSDTSDLVMMHINITVPLNEPPGDKAGNLTIQGVAS